MQHLTGVCFPLYQLDPQLNNKLELHILQQTRPPNPKPATCCIRNGSVGQQFIFLRKELFHKPPTRPVDIEPDFNYVHKMCQITTIQSEKQLPPNKILKF